MQVILPDYLHSFYLIHFPSSHLFYTSTQILFISASTIGVDASLCIYTTSLMANRRCERTLLVLTNQLELKSSLCRQKKVTLWNFLLEKHTKRKKRQENEIRKWIYSVLNFNNRSCLTFRRKCLNKNRNAVENWFNEVLRFLKNINSTLKLH